MTIQKADDAMERACDALRAAGWTIEEIADDDLESAADMLQSVNVSAPSKDQHHCAN